MQIQIIGFLTRYLKLRDIFNKYYRCADISIEIKKNRGRYEVKSSKDINMYVCARMYIYFSLKLILL